jgi:ribose transport system ATP-binding protein
MNTDRVVLRAEGVSKNYGGTHALVDMSLTLRAGEVHALVGGNGSGKSTFIKILAGVEQADRGELSLGESTVDARHVDADTAWRMGLRFVHQRSSIFPDLPIAENLAIGSLFSTGRGGRIRWREQYRQAAALLERFNIQADPRDLASTLSPARQTLLTIARALQNLVADETGILVLDEPTASLPRTETAELLEALRGYARNGQAILYVSHRLEEILAVADTVSVLRDGVYAGTYPRSELDHDSLVELISGRSWHSLTAAGRQPEAAPRSDREALVVSGLRGGPVRDASFSVCEGEIVGIAGLLGSGRSTLLRLLFGDIPRESGAVELDGRPLEPRSPQDAMRNGLAFVPEDRLREAAFPDLSVQDNISIANIGRYWRGAWIDRRRERSASARLLADLKVKTASPSQVLSGLSGGNQQKVVLARWMHRNPRVLLLDEPTQGVDVGARSDIHALLRTMAANGTACIVVSSDAEELELLCDRIFVMEKGRLVRGAENPEQNFKEQI